MPLIQISEPEQNAQRKPRVAIGIDLGTTNSLVATVKDGIAVTLADHSAKHLLPSVVRYEAQRIVVGDDAKQHSAEDPQNTIISVKRMMGRGVEDIKKHSERLPYIFTKTVGMPKIQTPQGERSPVEISAEILRCLKCRAEQQLNEEVSDAVITVPAYFDEAQRQATKDAAKLIDLKVLRLLNEPTAAAIAYGLDSQEQGVIAVYDLGGGTFDVSILRLNKGVFEVLATGGDSALGGDDFDHAIVEFIIKEKALKNVTPPQQRQLLNQAKAAKEALTEQDAVEVVGVHLAREQLHKLVEALVSKTLLACQQTLKDAGMTVDTVDNVVMVGGSTRMPYVQQQVEKLFQKKPLNNIDPDKVVAIGAAIQADILVGNRAKEDLLLLDVIPLSLGLETMGGLMEKIIERNTTIPALKSEEFTTFKDGQTGMVIHVLQGERELAADCRSLAKFELKGIPPMKAGAAKIKVTFQVDADALLEVTAVEESTGIAANVQVKPSYGLSDEEMETMLKNSYTYAKQDYRTRQLREMQVEAQRILEAVNQALAEDADLLSQEELQDIQEKVTALSILQLGNQATAIAKALKAVDKATQEFARRRMNAKIKGVLQGRNVGEFE